MAKPKKRKAGPKKVRASTAAKLQRLAEETLALRNRATLAEGQLERFEEKDLPAFEDWMEKHFAAERKELDAMLQEVEFHEAVLDEAQFAYMDGVFRTEAEAVRTVKREMEAERAKDAEPEDDPENDPEVGPDFGEGMDDGEMPEEMIDFLFGTFMFEMRGVDVDEMSADAYDKARADFVSTFEHAEKGDHSAFEKALLKAGADESAGNVSAVKSTYRRLAKRLHPDHNTELGETEKGLWHQACLHYRGLDLKGLEEIDIALTLERGESIEPAKGAALRRYHDELADRIDFIEGDLSDNRGHPAWEFSLKKSAAALNKRIRREMEEALAETREDLAELKGLVAAAMKPKAKRRPAKKKASKKKAAAKKGTAAGKEAADQEEFEF